MAKTARINRISGLLRQLTLNDLINLEHSIIKQYLEADSDEPLYYNIGTDVKEDDWDHDNPEDSDTYPHQGYFEGDS